MLVASQMPPTSDALPLLGVYYVATIFIVSLATGFSSLSLTIAIFSLLAMTVFTLNIHHHGQNGKPVPILVQRIAFGYIAKALFMNTGYYHSINEHVEYFYTKEHGHRDSREDKTHLAWMSKKFDYSTPSPTINRLSQRTSAPTVCSPLSKEHNVSFLYSLSF
jgi:hypothetical protein